MARCTSCLGCTDGLDMSQLMYSVPAFAEKPPTVPNRQQKTVAIIGGGLSGVAAAIEALSQGAFVIMIEKEKFLGVNSIFRLEGLNAIGSMSQRERGLHDSAELFVKDTQRFSGVAPVFPALFARHSLEGLVFLSELGLPLRSLALAPGHSVPRTLRPEEIRGTIGGMVHAVMKQYLEARSDQTELLLGTVAEALIVKEGRVSGVRCRRSRVESSAATKSQEINADVVVIATGGFAANSTMLHQYAPTVASMPLSCAASNGEGIVLAVRDANAALLDMDRIAPGIGVIDRNEPRAGMVHVADEMRSSGAFLVNSRGERFVDETASARVICTAMQRHCQPLGQGMPIVAYLVFNEKAVATFQRGAFAFYQSRGLVSKYGSSRAAAQALAFPPNWGSNLAEEIKLAKTQGKDKYGRKDALTFAPEDAIRKAPSYIYVMFTCPVVLTVTPSLGATLGGLKTTAQGQVVAVDGKPIPGLYAAGSVVGGLHGAEVLAGNALLASVVFSRLVVRAALNATRPGRLLAFGGVDYSAAFAELSRVLGPRISRKIPDLIAHCHDASYHNHQLPLAVVYAEETKDVSETLKVCNRHSLPVTAWGMGSSLEGHSTPVVGGIILSLQRMKAVLTQFDGDMQVVVQPGIRQRELNTLLASKGIFFPVDPGSNPTLGGMVANGSSGTTTVGYGTMRENVKSLEAVLADGSVIVTSSRAKKSSAGYDLTHLLIGSEGTLAIITAITLKVYKIPVVAAAVASFPSVDMAARTVMATLQKGVPVHRIELLNTLMIDAVNKKFNMKFALRPTLFLEFHGANREVVLQNSAEFRKAAAMFGMIDMNDTADDKEREEMWRARHGAYFAACSIRQNTKILITDICVPLSRFAEAIVETEEDFATTKPTLPSPIVGHAGDGNFHVMVPFDASSPSEVAALTALNARLVRRALRLGGTCTGEHGVGLGKRQWLEEEHGKPAVDVMRQLKKALDPKGILNPDKVVEMPLAVVADAPQAKL